MLTHFRCGIDCIMHFTLEMSLETASTNTPVANSRDLQGEWEEKELGGTAPQGTPALWPFTWF